MILLISVSTDSVKTEKDGEMFCGFLGNVRSASHLCPKNCLIMSSLQAKSERGTHCLECGRFVGFGRPDRKFCSQECKNRWHNRQRKYSWRGEQARILRILESNHLILERMLRMGIQSVDRITLRQLGFNPDYVTYYQKVGGHSLYGCYDIQYEATPSRLFRLRSLVTPVSSEDS